jgi:hypothetical protein
MAFKQLGSLAMATTAWETLYTCPSGKTVIVSRISMLNNNASLPCDMLLLAGAGVSAVYYVSGASNTPAYGGEMKLDGGIILNAGESIYTYCSVARGTAIAWGDEITASSTLKQLGAVGITQNSWTTVYQCPTGKTTYVSKIILNNGYFGTGQTAEATMYLAHIPSGQSVATKYYIVSQRKVLKNGGRIEIGGGIVLSAGDILSAYSTQTSGNCVAWGDEQTAGTAKMLNAIDITSGAWTEVYTVPASKQTIVSKMIMINNNASYARMYAEHIPSGQSSADKYFITSFQHVLQNGGYRELTGGICLATGDKVRVFSYSADGTCIMWGDEMNV